MDDIDRQPATQGARKFAAVPWKKMSKNL